MSGDQSHPHLQAAALAQARAQAQVQPHVMPMPVQVSLNVLNHFGSLRVSAMHADADGGEPGGLNKAEVACYNQALETVRLYMAAEHTFIPKREGETDGADGPHAGSAGY